MTPFTYTAYGLRVASSFPLPELMPCDAKKPDIVVKYGTVPKSLACASEYGLAWQSEPGKLLLTVSDVGRFLIIEDREILIEPLPGVREFSVRIFLLGSVLGALLHMRKMLVLHSSVIRSERGAILFTGKSGAGKSTLLGSFLQRGYAMLADDKAGIVVNSETGEAFVMPGFPFARLTRETVENLNYPVGNLQVFSELGKYLVPVKNFCREPLKIHTVYATSPHNKNEIRFENIENFDAFQVLVRATYRRRFVHRDEQRKAQFEIIGALSKQARVVRVLRPDDASRIEELADRIEEDFSR